MSKPYDRISMKAFPIKFSELIKNPAFFKDSYVLAFEISKRQMSLVHTFAKVHEGKLKSVLLTMEPYHNTWSEQAQRFLFTVRDRICGATGDYSAENKEQIYAAAMIEAGFINENGSRKSLHDLDKREMGILIETMLRLAIETDCDVSDLEALGDETRKSLKEE